MGRERDNLLHITEHLSAYISRHHCTIETNPATDIWIIRDGQWQKELKLWQDSSNVTYVNSTQDTRQGHILKIADIISIGDVK
ncbi:FHA domain-containing protein [Bacteroides thetaiotaomicron]|uniref:FHA domain-containing protein n=1 Tax=Bacteroides thetaiotaomicron TaxID=818 RepID=UPI002672573E|nr:FHA domain-containing protein [Bacteroides thetaiotaomicron]